MRIIKALVEPKWTPAELNGEIVWFNDDGEMFRECQVCMRLFYEENTAKCEVCGYRVCKKCWTELDDGYVCSKECLNIFNSEMKGR